MCMAGNILFDGGHNNITHIQFNMYILTAADIFTFARDACDAWYFVSDSNR